MASFREPGDGATRQARVMKYTREQQAESPQGLLGCAGGSPLPISGAVSPRAGNQGGTTGIFRLVPHLMRDEPCFLGDED